MLAAEVTDTDDAVQLALEAPGLEPSLVDDKNAKAHYRHGVLTVTLPKIAGPRGRRIAVELH